MTKTSKTIRRMPDIRKVILARLKALEMSHYALVQKLGDKVTKTTTYDYLAGKSELSGKSIGHILDVLDLDITPKAKR